MLPGKALSLSKICPRNVDGALSLEKPYYLHNGILGRDQDQHAKMIGLEMPFYFPKTSNFGSLPAEPGI